MASIWIPGRTSPWSGLRVPVLIYTDVCDPWLQPRHKPLEFHGSDLAGLLLALCLIDFHDSQWLPSKTFILLRLRRHNQSAGQKLTGPCTASKSEVKPEMACGTCQMKPDSVSGALRRPAVLMCCAAPSPKRRGEPFSVWIREVNSSRNDVKCALQLRNSK